MLISCDTCLMQHSNCRDCVVGAVGQPKPRRGAVVVDADEERALASSRAPD